MQKVRLLGINGSARKSGNSQFLLEQAGQAALETGQRKNALETLYREGSRDAQVAVQGSRTMGRRVVELALIIKTGAYVLRDMLSQDGVYSGLLKQLSPEWGD